MTISTNNKQGITILSIDPGCRNTGWAVCTITPNKKIRVVDHGVLKHDYDLEINAKFILGLIQGNYIVLIEDPPIVRVNASTSHALAKIFGALMGAIVNSGCRGYLTIAPRSWQYYILRDHYKKAKANKTKINDAQKELLIKKLVNTNITRKEEVVNPHVLDTIGMVIYFCEKYNGTIFESVDIEKVLLDNSINLKSRRKKTSKKKKKNS